MQGHFATIPCHACCPATRMHPTRPPAHDTRERCFATSHLQVGELERVNGRECLVHGAPRACVNEVVDALLRRHLQVVVAAKADVVVLLEVLDVQDGAALVAARPQPLAAVDGLGRAGLRRGRDGVRGGRDDGVDGDRPRHDRADQAIAGLGAAHQRRHAALLRPARGDWFGAGLVVVAKARGGNGSGRHQSSRLRSSTWCAESLLAARTRIARQRSALQPASQLQLPTPAAATLARHALATPDPQQHGTLRQPRLLALQATATLSTTSHSALVAQG